MSFRDRLDVVPGTTSCRCGHDLRYITATPASSTLLTTQSVLDDAMGGHRVTLAGDALPPSVFFVVFRTIAHVIRVTGYDLDGHCWAPEAADHNKQRLSAMDLGTVQAILEQTGKILTLSPQDAEAAARELKHRASLKPISLGWRFQRARLERSMVGRVGKILNTWTPL